VFIICLIIALAIGTYLIFMGETMEEALAKKYGWDGKSRYRIQAE
jgi:hypothetical protein